MSNNTTDPNVSHLWDNAHALDKASVWFCLITGIPGNIFIFLTMRSLPFSVATFHYQLLAVCDGVALCMQLSMRGVDWYNLTVITSHQVNIGWKIYFNVAYFTSIYANWVLVYIAMERLIALRYPSQIHIYLTVPRAKLNAVLTALLIYSFSIIVIVKVKYFGIPWLVVFTTFYTAFPLLIVFIIIWLLIGTMGEQRRLKKKMQKEAHHHHHHHHKNGHKSTATTPIASHPTSTGHTPPGAISRSPTSPTESKVPTMTKSNSGISRQSGNGHKGKSDTTSLGGTSLSRQSASSSKREAQPTPTTTLHAFFKAPTFSFTDNTRRPVRAPTPEPEEQLPPELITQKAKEKKDLDRCYTYMMLVTSICFVILTIPYTVVEYIYVADEREITDIFNEKQAKMYLLIIMALGMMYVEHSCNFYIFFLFSWRFRQQFIRVMTRKTATPTVDPAKDAEQSKTMV